VGHKENDTFVYLPFVSDIEVLAVIVKQTAATKKFYYFLWDYLTNSLEGQKRTKLLDRHTQTSLHQTLLWTKTGFGK
jgi:hypothetical protein